MTWSAGPTLAGHPLRFHATSDADRWEGTADGAITITAGPRTDLFIDPAHDAVESAPRTDAPRLLGTIDGEVTLSARVRVAFAGDFDAGALLFWAGEGSWGKLCFEVSPQGQPMVVSVVTRGDSDDANAFPVDGDSVWLRIARLGRDFAFHASLDSGSWSFVRHFALGEEGPAAQVGFLTQSPRGEGCTATFDDIRLTRGRLRDLRDSS